MLEMDLVAIITTIVVFLLLVYFLNFKLYRPLLAFMDNRSESISRDQQNLMKNSDDLNAGAIEIEKILSEAKTEAAKIKQVAVESIKKKADIEIKKTEEELQKDFECFKNELDSQKEEIKNALTLKIPEFKNNLKDVLSRI